MGGFICQVLVAAVTAVAVVAVSEVPVAVAAVSEVPAGDPVVSEDPAEVPVVLVVPAEDILDTDRHRLLLWAAGAIADLAIITVADVWAVCSR